NPYVTGSSPVRGATSPLSAFCIYNKYVYNFDNRLDIGLNSDKDGHFALFSTVTIIGVSGYRHGAATAGAADSGAGR
ncbi:hypothetical protein LZ645_00570, partial [Shewanella algae]